MPLKKIAFAAFMAFLYSCTDQNRVSIVDTGFGDEVELQQNLLFRFNRDMIADSLIGKWDSTGYITITPYVKGLFKWQNARELIFSPASGFQPSTNYTAKTALPLLNLFAKNTKPGNEVISFHTSPLKITGSNGWWTRNADGGLTLNLGLRFNYSVDATQAASFINMAADAKQEISVTQGAEANEIILKQKGYTSLNASGTEVKVTVKNGFKCIPCNEALDKDLVYTTIITAPDRLAVEGFTSTYAGGEGIVEIRFNQPVEPDDIKHFIKVDPHVAYTIEGSETGVAIRGEFAEDQDYSITVFKGTKGLSGGTLVSDWSENIAFATVAPAIQFTNSKGIYLSGASNKLLGITISSIPSVRVLIYKVYENNLPAFLRQNRYYDYWDEGGTVTYSDYDLKHFGDVVMEQVYETKSLPRNAGKNFINLDFNDKIGFNGLYLVSVRSTDDQWIHATKLVSVSDMGVIARTGSDEIVVFVNSLKTAQPVNNAKVKVISTNNQQLYSGTTNSDGMVRFQSRPGQYSEFKAGLISVTTWEDYNCMVLEDNRVELSRFETGGLSDNPSGLHAYIYGDREIYRPGDTVYLNTIIRKSNGTLAGEIPVKTKILLPNGREFASMKLNMGKQGAAESRFYLPPSAVTGTYRMEAFTFNDVLIGSYSFSVEEFIPDRISVKTATDKALYILSDSIHLTATALNLFGPPAAGRNYETDFSLSIKQFSPKGFEKYTFSVNGDSRSLPGIFRQGKTHADGTIHETFSLSPSVAASGMLAGKIYLTVFDETGRPVNRLETFDIATQKIFYGIRLSDGYASTGQPLKASLVSLDMHGKPVPSSAQLKLIKINYHNALQRNYDRYQYVSRREEKVISTQNINISGESREVTFTPAQSGEYAVRIYINENRYVEKTFYAFGWGLTTAGSFPVNTDGEIEISTDKAVYQPGDEARILFKTPFAGKLLITIERNSVLEHCYVNTDKRSAEYKLKIKDEYLPTIYITATLFRPVDDGSIPLTVAHGTLPVHIEKKENRIPLSIIAASHSKSHTRQNIKVKTKPGQAVELTIAVVDEGIMQLKNSVTPDPYNYFYQKRALSVNSYDLYSLLLPDIKLRRSSTGGDGYNLQKRVNPLTNKRVKLIASWSGILKTNAAGEAQYTMDIPQYSGDLRIMAVAWHNHSFGSAEHHIKVADNVVISTALPRFTSPGDTLYIPVTLTNTTTQAVKTFIEMQVSGPMKAAGITKEEMVLTANNESPALFKAFTLPTTGNATVKITARGNGEKFTDVTEITVRPPSSLQKVSKSGMLQAGQEHTLDLRTGFIPESVESEFFISRSPVMQFADHLRYLLDYPHGCAEQITSIAFPQIYFADLASALKNSPGRSISPAENINAAINLLQSMQLYNGSLAYWPGSAQESWWSTIYATHFLSEARKAGYAVNSNVMNKLLNYLEKKSKEKNVERLVYYDNNGEYRQRSIPAKDIFYSLYILALNGRRETATMNYYKNRWDDLAIDSRYLLACTYLASGDRKNYELLLPRQFEGEKSVNATGGNFYSFIRDESLAMNALLETDPDNIQLPDMAMRISMALSENKWLNTQERAFSFLALGKYLKRNASNNATAEIILADNSKVAFTGKNITLKNKSDGIVRINVEGNGSLYYLHHASGLSATGTAKETDNNLKIRRSFLDRSGNPITGNKFKVNDLIVVKLTLSNMSGSQVENVVITDMLPAGFEIENPRISAVPEMQWIKDHTEPEHLDIRDDRIHFFTSAGYQPRNYYYLVRAVSAGNFTTGTVSADAMYNGQYHSSHGAGRIIIQ